MKKKEAIRLITELKENIKPESLNDQWWLDDAWVRITSIFGDNNEHLARPMYGSYYHLEPNLEVARQSVVRLKALFDTYISMINNGFYKRKRNLFSRFSDEILVTASIAILGLVAWLGFTYGVYTSNIETYDLKTKLKACEDSRQH